MTMIIILNLYILVGKSFIMNDLFYDYDYDIEFVHFS